MIRNRHPWLLALALIACTLATSAGQLMPSWVEISTSAEYYAAFTDSSVSTIALSEDIQLQASDWDDYSINNPYNLTRNLNVTSAPGLYPVLDFNFLQHRCRCVRSHVNNVLVLLVCMIRSYTSWHPSACCWLLNYAMPTSHCCASHCSLRPRQCGLMFQHSCFHPCWCRLAPEVVVTFEHVVIKNVRYGQGMLTTWCSVQTALV